MHRDDSTSSIEGSQTKDGFLAPPPAGSMHPHCFFSRDTFFVVCSGVEEKSPKKLTFISVSTPLPPSLHLLVAGSGLDAQAEMQPRDDAKTQP